VQLLHKRKNYDERRIAYIPAHMNANLKEEEEKKETYVSAQNKT